MIERKSERRGEKKEAKDKRGAGRANASEAAKTEVGREERKMEEGVCGGDKKERDGKQ